MIRLTLLFSSQDEKGKILSDISNLGRYKILNISKEYPGKGKSLHRRIYIDLTEK